MLRVLGLRFAIKSIAASRTYRPAHSYSFRSFSTTPRWQAAEVPDEFINAIKHTTLFQKLADKPNALKALSDLYSLTKEMGAYLRALCPVFLRGEYCESLTSSEGLDINSTTPPSQYQMFKLVTNRRFVRAVKRVMEELNAAGFKLNSDVCTLLLLAHTLHLTIVRLGCIAGDYGIDTRETT
jgi:hypothetical protein